MEYDHIMTPDEIDDLFREAVKQLAGKTDIRVTMIQTERKRLSDDRVCCIITSAIWNDSPQKACLSVNSYIINNKREQHQRDRGCPGHDISGFVNIQPDAHVIKGDVFFEEYTDIVSAGWVYGIEITDTNWNVYDIQFELNANGKWHEIER
ncbi:MAG: hypothetical protein IJ641_09130 [Lachnospiraceae bacterium]|nr:hypothetical protein [Lachnospiraceae bacterium]